MDNPAQEGSSGVSPCHPMEAGRHSGGWMSGGLTGEAGSRVSPPWGFVVQELMGGALSQALI